MNSVLLECRLLHHRLRPRDHRFTNRIFFAALNLAELDEISRGLSLFSRNGRNVYAIRDRDFLPARTTTDEAEPGLMEKTRRYLQDHDIEFGSDLRVVLVAIPRIAGYFFNPVVFYFCYAGSQPICAVAEVTNTFREVKTFLVRPAADGKHFEARIPKEFYVSPFSECDGEFFFSLRYDGKGLVARIDEYERGKLAVHTVVVGKRRALTDWNLAWFLVKYPLLGVQVMVRIHTQALRLYLKGLPWWRKVAQAERQKDYYRPEQADEPAHSGAIER